MARLKHVLVLTILILPMFVLAPSLVAGPTGVQANEAVIDTSVPATSVQRTLRVAVYAEDNTSLPAYATGGVYTDHYQNVINLLESAGYAVTALTTQDILDHKLMVADFDAFVLPNQLPKDEIVDFVKDYWLGGGGILNFANSVGFCFYAGIIDPSYEGSDQLGPEWMWGSGFPNITIVDRHPVTKSYDIGDRFIELGAITFFNPTVAATTSDRYIPLAVNDIAPDAWNIFALDNPNRGGRFVHVPGNCSIISSWLEPIIIDAVDWLAPRPKGRILFDLSHLPEVTPDSWDPWIEAHPLTTWRNGLVNHSYIVDKLYPSSEGNLTSDNLEGYDMLVICMPNINFTAQEITDIMNWVADGGGLLTVSDDPNSFAHMSHRLNDLLTLSDIRYNATVIGPFDTVASQVGEHPIHESTSNIVVSGFSYPYIVGPNAYPVWEHPAVGLAVVGEEFGQGRIIAYPDGNFMTDNLGLFELDNYQFHLNVANWLTAAKAKVLVYADTIFDAHPNAVPLNGPVAQALNDLQIPFYLTDSGYYFNMSLFSQDWDMVVFDNTQHGTSSYQQHLIDFVAGGGKVIFSTWALNIEMGDYFGVRSFGHIGDPTTVLISEPTHPIFNLPAPYGADNLTTTLDLGFGTDALNLTVHANATALAGYEGYTGAAITLGVGGNVIFNGPLLTIYNDDTDDSTYPDNLEIWENEIAFLYFDRPIIDHPADVTYMETETGNEITWTPTADAGPWEYVFSVNGTPVQGGHWTGAPLTFNVDGVNVSITEYELTVFDRLGYSVSDLVTLNVTEYVEPPGPGPGIDPMLLLIIGGAVAGIVIILVVVMQLKKKK